MSELVPHIHQRRKIKFESEPTEWLHQRGGWSYVIQQLRSHLYAPDGVLCISAVEEIVFKQQIVTEPWIGFVHQIPCNNYPYYPDLERLVKDEVFLKSLENCLGLLVISRPVKEYLVKHVAVPVANVSYPITPFSEELKFSWKKFEGESSKQVLFVGEFMRNFQAFFDLQVPEGYKKILLKPPDVNFDNLYNVRKEKIDLKMNNSVSILERVEDDTYDQLLSSSIVFLNMYEAAANTTVLECLGRQTPLIINRLPGVEEYLGEKYPLFYDTLDEASSLLTDNEKLLGAVKYMVDHYKSNPLTSKRFVHEVASSAVYRPLPLPASQKSDSTQTKFPHYDLSVVICSYKRVYNMKSLLECFLRQDFPGKFELILWNNNKETQEEIAQICSPFMEKLNMRLIQSSENYYCIIRLAVTQLMRSDILVVCDDDVIPNSNYISTFMTKYEEYGRNIVLGCRGHVFKQHSLNTESPHRFWEDYHHLKFFDEAEPDRQVHFLHADSWLIPRSLLLSVATYPLPSPDYILVDDYWMSFVLSHHLKIPLWKIKGDTIMALTKCAEDESIALYHNKDVREQSVDFYCYHMSQGWPASCPLEF